MTYFVSLKITAIIVGLLLALGHLPMTLAPERATPTLRKLPRNYPLGVVLMLAATIWFVTLTGLMDLGEISSIRTQLMAVWAISGIPSSFPVFSPPADWVAFCCSPRRFSSTPVSSPRRRGATC
jgi:hypothetical protein